MATIRGTADDDELFGTQSEDLIEGLGGNDLLRGRLGDDRLDGGDGADEMRGREGDDTYFVDSRFDRVVERAGEGIDTVFATVNFILRRDVENLELNGLARRGIGNDLDNRIVAFNTSDSPIGVVERPVNNVLDGGAGADFMDGGFGDDTFYVDNPGDTIRLKDSQDSTDNDTVFASVSYALGDDLNPEPNRFAYLDNLVLTGSEAIDGTGNGLANHIIGNDAANVIRGGGMGDMLEGRGGDDQIFGGTGGNRMSGGAGADRFYISTLTADFIEDFTPSDESIYLDREIFTEIEEGALDPDAFHLGTEAQDEFDRIIYNAETGRVSYDPDGTGSQESEVVIVVTPGTELTSADFFGFT